MNSASPAPSIRAIDITAYPNYLYPPVRGEGPSSATVVAISPPGTDITFSMTLNGESGPFEGLTMLTRREVYDVALVHASREFLLAYDGPWPAQLQVHAWFAEGQVESISLWIYDTRAVLPAAMNVRLAPDPGLISEVEDTRVEAIGTFFDDHGREIPVDEVLWELQLPGAPQGVSVEGHGLRLTPEAQAGQIQVKVLEASGLEQSIAHELVSRRFDVEISQYDLYVPYIEEFVLVTFETARLSEEFVVLDCLLDGSREPRPGFDWRQFTDMTGEMFFSNEFIKQYPGTWPIEVKVNALLHGQVLGSSTLWLHDTRTVKVERLELELAPSEVTIPKEGKAGVIGYPKFYDASGVSVPFREVTHRIRLANAVEGVEHYGNIFLVSPEAKPSQFKVFLDEASGLQNMAVLTLVSAPDA